MSKRTNGTANSTLVTVGGRFNRWKCLFFQKMANETLTAELKTLAKELGFAAAGVTPAVAAPGTPRLHDWLARGYAGEMNYFAQRLAAYSDLNFVLEGARSLLVLAVPYRTEEPPEDLSPGSGRVSRYAWGTDYHRTLWDRMEPLCELIRMRVPGAKARGVTDSAPLLEREFAQLAGLGWIGKNTLLLHRELGSWFFLSVVITDVELVADEPYTEEYCGTCRACLEACPTDAFVQPYLLDATKCLSYLTIEVRGEIPAAQHGVFTDWLWGCDICQEVCPWNNKAPVSVETAWQPTPGRTMPDLIELFSWDEERFRAEFRHTPLWRAKRRGLLRNAALLLGNQATQMTDTAQKQKAIDALQKALSDQEELIRKAAAWALERYAFNRS
jgi:epoxyqueuosine reductase